MNTDETHDDKVVFNRNIKQKDQIIMDSCLTAESNQDILLELQAKE